MATRRAPADTTTDAPAETEAPAAVIETPPRHAVPPDAVETTEAPAVASTARWDAEASQVVVTEDGTEHRMAREEALRHLYDARAAFVADGKTALEADEHFAFLVAALDEAGNAHGPSVVQRDNAVVEMEKQARREAAQR